jgi:uncharacterized tellurite resistance protein B-like protein
MFRQMMQLLTAAPAEFRAPPDLRDAVAVLLVEAAHRDDVFGPEERAVITRLLKNKYALSERECGELMAAAEHANANITQLHPYTRAVTEQMDYEARLELIEMMWEVVYADGVLDPDEDALIRRLANLIYVTDRDRVLARQRVVARSKG